MSTFNLKQHMTKHASMAYEGSQGYFLAHQRAWMNCSKCKRVEGKTAQEAWQECFEEFQVGDRTLEWLSAYAEDDAKKISKESAVDYSDDVVKLASSGMAIGGAVTSVLQQRLAAWPSWLGGKGSQSTQQPAQATPEQVAINEQRKQQIQQNKANNPTNQQGFTQQQVQDNEARKKSVLQTQQNSKTYNVLTQVSQLISQGEYDTDAIRKMIMGIPDVGVKTKLNKYVTYLKGVEQRFHAQMQELSKAATQMMKYYIDNGRKAFFEQEAQQAPQGLAASDNSAVKTADHVLRTYDVKTDRWTYYGGQDGQTIKGANLSTAVRLTKTAAVEKTKELITSGRFYMAVEDSEGDWSKLNGA